MKNLNVLLAVLVSLAIFLGVFELGLRLIGKGPATTLNQFDAKVGWVKVPERTITRKKKEFKVTYKLNEHGMRDDENLRPAKPEGTTRVIALGDSFTLGFSVEREDLFVDHLEKWWQAEDRQVEVINAGTEGYSTDQEVVWLKETGADWEPDLVLLFAYENDILYNGQDSYLRFPKPRFDSDGALVSGTLTKPASRPSTAIGNLFAEKMTLDTFSPPVAQRPIKQEWAPLFNNAPDFLQASIDGTRGAFKALRAACDELKTEVAVVIIPSHSAVDDDFAKHFSQVELASERSDWDPNRSTSILKDAAESAGLITFDATESLRAAASTSEAPLYFEEDFHLTPTGNRALAKFVHAQLRERGLSPGQGKVIAAMPDMPGPKSRWWPSWLPLFLFLWAVVGSLYGAYYKDEKVAMCFLKVGALLGVIFTIALSAAKGLAMLPPSQSRLALVGAILLLFGFIFYKLGDRLGTITELCLAFIKRGHWYLMPLVMILLSVGSLLVVAASSPLVAPFIYTLF